MEMLKDTLDSAASWVKQFWLALFAGLSQFLGGLILVTAGDEGLEGITLNQWLVIALSVLAAIGYVYGLERRNNS